MASFLNIQCHSLWGAEKQCNVHNRNAFSVSKTFHISCQPENCYLTWQTHTLVTEKALWKTQLQKMLPILKPTLLPPGVDSGWLLSRRCALVMNTHSQDDFSSSRYSQSGIWENKEFSKSHDTIAPQMIIGDFTSKSSQLTPGFLGFAKLDNLEIKNLIL